MSRIEVRTGYKSDPRKFLDSPGRVVAYAPRSAARLRLDADLIIHRSANPLFAAEITFGCLDRDVAEQKLDLLQLSASGMAQLRARPPQVMRRDGPEAEFGSILLHLAEAELITNPAYNEILLKAMLYFKNVERAASDLGTRKERERVLDEVLAPVFADSGPQS